MRKEKMEKFFHLKENGTTVSTEIMAGLTTFFAMSYIIIVNPQILSSTCLLYTSDAADDRFLV